MVTHFAQRLGHPDPAHLAGQRQSCGQRQNLMQADGKLPLPVTAGDEITEAVELDVRIRQQARLPQAPFRLGHHEARGRQIAVPHQGDLHCTLHGQGRTPRDAICAAGREQHRAKRTGQPKCHSFFHCPDDRRIQSAAPVGGMGHPFGCQTRTSCRAVARAHFARGCSGQSRRLIDGRNQRGRSTGRFHKQQGGRLRNSEDKGRPR